MSCDNGYHMNDKGYCVPYNKRSFEQGFIGPQRLPSGNIMQAAFQNKACPRGYNRNRTTGNCTRGRYSLDVSRPRAAYRMTRYVAPRKAYKKKTARKTARKRCKVGSRRVGSRCVRY